MRPRAAWKWAAANAFRRIDVGKKDEVMPQGRWTFDGDVTDSFDDMLARSIPQYEVMRRSCFEVGDRFVRDRTDVVDLGCSRGEALAPFVERHGALCRYVGVEVSEPMLAAARERFAGYVERGVVDVKGMDLRREYPPVEASLTLLVLTLQFTPIEHRQRILQDVHDHTLPGGALVMVEKVLGADAKLDGLMVDLYLNHKREAGYTEEQIQRKKLSLEGVLVPVTAAWNEELLRMAGFRRVDCFWRWFNFAGWIAVKD